MTTSNCSNNYGYYHFPEKLIPLCLTNILDSKPLPIYGDGKQIRDWLFVEDHCRGIELVLDKGVVGETYNIGGVNEWQNIDIVNLVCKLVDAEFAADASLAARYPHELSGGERQRVGVARALATRPPVLLMDEPFGSVDPQGRRRLQREFASIQRALGTTVMMVTHDIREAALLADRIAVFSRGAVLEQLDTPEAVTGNPANEFVADFVADFAA